MVSLQPPLQDPEAFSSLFDHTQIILFRFIYGMLGGPIEDVEDLTCDTYYRAWRSRSRFNGNEHDALCWLFTIARRLVIDQLRQKKSHPIDAAISLDDSSLEFMLPTSQASPEELASTAEPFTHLWRLLQKLPDDRREMLVLRYIIGWKVKEIAIYLEMEENTVSVYIKRCLEQLRHEWSDG